MSEDPRDEEITVLESILNLDAEKTFHAHKDPQDDVYSGMIKIHPVIDTSEFAVTYYDDLDDDRRRFIVSHLPPVILNFILPADYPETSPPEFRLNCCWLNREQLDEIRREMDAIWSRGQGQVVLFEFVSLLRDDLLRTLKIEDKLELNSSAKRKSGFVDRFADKRGFGFVKSDDVEYFFHVSDVIKSEGKVEKGDKITFEVSEKEEGRKSAVKVSKSGFFTHEIPRIVALIRENEAKMKEKSFLGSVFRCKVCFDEKLGSNCTKFHDCDHVFCSGCMKSHFEVQIRQNLVNNLKCPEENCSSQANPDQVKALIAPDLFSRYEKKLLESTLEQMSDVVHCPRRHCQLAVVIEPERNMGQCSNPDCGFVFCAFCRQTYHGVQPCKITSEELKKYLESEDEEEKAVLEKKYGKKQLGQMVSEHLSNVYKEEQAKKCPNCSAFIQKSDGCNKMTCNKCGTHFCYLCGKRLPRVNPYSHFNDSNEDCAGKLFLGVMGQDEVDDDEFEFRPFEVADDF